MLIDQRSLALIHLLNTRRLPSDPSRVSMSSATTALAREEERAIKSASKEIASVYKSWVGALKSKNWKSVSGLAPFDDDFLLTFGGIGVLMKMISRKDLDAKVRSLHYLVESMGPVEALADAFVCPAPLHVRRCMATIQSGISMGQTVS